MSDIDPTFLDFAERYLEIEFSLSADEMLARRRSLARSLEITTQAEVADLRSADARRILGIER